jgi:hypothetical protein
MSFFSPHEDEMKFVMFDPSGNNVDLESHKSKVRTENFLISCYLC